MEVEDELEEEESKVVSILKKPFRLNNVSIAKLCHSMDLIAVSTYDSSTSIYRLCFDDKDNDFKWQKLSIIDGGGVNVKSMAWRPDGKILVLGKENGEIQLVNVELGEICGGKQEKVMKGAITSLLWVQRKEDGEEFTGGNPYIDRTNKFLPPLPQLSSEATSSFAFNNENNGASSSDGNNSSSDFLRLKNDNGTMLPLHVLVVGDSSGKINLYALGHFLLATLEIPAAATSNILNANLSHDFSLLSVIISQYDKVKKKKNILLRCTSTTNLFKYNKEIAYIAFQADSVSTLMDHVALAMKQISSVWKECIKPLESKLEAFSTLLVSLIYVCKGRYGRESTPKGEFFHFLTSGVPSPALMQFLSTNLAENHLKRIQKAIETAMQKLKKLIFDHLIHASEALLFRLSDIRGLSFNKQTFCQIGWKKEDCDVLALEAEIFKMKCTELGSVAIEMTADLDAFLKWLAIVIPRISSDGSSAPSIASGLNDQPRPDMERVFKLLSSSEDNPNSINSFLQSSFVLHFTTDSLNLTSDKSKKTKNIFIEGTNWSLSDTIYNGKENKFDDLTLQSQFDNLKISWSSSLHKMQDSISSSIKALSKPSILVDGPEGSNLIVKMRNRKMLYNNQICTVLGVINKGCIWFARSITNGGGTDVAALKLSNIDDSKILDFEFCGEVLGSTNTRINGESLGILIDGFQLPVEEGEKAVEDKGEVQSSILFYNYDELDWKPSSYVMENFFFVPQGLMKIVTEAGVVPQDLELSKAYHLKSKDVTSMSISSRNSLTVVNSSGLLLFSLE